MTNVTTLTAARSKRRKSALAHVVKEFPNGYSLTWFYALCGRYLSRPETLPWEDTAPEDRCPRCVKRLAQERSS